MTKKGKPRSRIDDVTWKLFKEACGDRCCGRDCAKPDGVPLEQGHLDRHEDGGLLIFENLIPLCKSCNAKNKDGFTPDGRAVGWRSRFWPALLATNQTAIRVHTLKPGCTPSPANEVTEKKEFIDLQTAEFVFQKHYIHPNAKHPQTQARALPEEAEEMLRRVISKSLKVDPQPKRPFGKRRAKLLRACCRVGTYKFWWATQCFLWEKPWLLDEATKRVAADSWQHLDESFDDYVVEGEAAAKRSEEQKAEHREKAEQIEADIRTRRWQEYSRMATITDWPGMPEDVKPIIAAVKESVSAGGSRELTDREYEDSCRAWRCYTQDKLLESKKVEVRELMTVWAEYATRSSLPQETKQELFGTLKKAGEWLEEAEKPPQVQEIREMVERAVKAFQDKSMDEVAKEVAEINATKLVSKGRKKKVKHRNR